jgi:hypothetical protein
MKRPRDVLSRGLRVKLIAYELTSPGVARIPKLPVQGETRVLFHSRNIRTVTNLHHRRKESSAT